MRMQHQTFDFRNWKRGFLMIFLTGCMLAALAGQSAAFDKGKRRPGRPGGSTPQTKTGATAGNAGTQRKDLLKGIGSKTAPNGAKAKNSGKKP